MFQVKQEKNANSTIQNIQVHKITDRIPEKPTNLYGNQKN